ncbi:MAG: hypothetical protein NVSMB17_18250 [Candidatus Dormibacteria bacterium]
MNAALTVADHCAWVGSRNDAAVQVLDISNPSAPVRTGALPRHPGSTPRELRAVPRLRLLVVMYYRLGGGPNRFDIFHWDSECGAANLVGGWDFGRELPHEFYLWQDPAVADRVLLYTTMFGAAAQQLKVLDIAVPARPVMVGGWTVPAAYGHAPVHSVSLAGDGVTAYVALWTGGLVVGDVSDFARGRADPTFRPLTPPANAFRTSPGTVHSAVPLDLGTRLLVTDERYPAPFGPGCPFGPAHVVEIADPAHAAATATLAVPENDPNTCAAAPRGTWTSHNVTVAAHLALVSWYSAGLQVFDVPDAGRPSRLAEWRATGVSPLQRDLELGVTDTLTWSYPVIYRGLVYVVDINQGLLVLRYSGPHDAELRSVGLADGSTNARPADPEGAPAPRSSSPLTSLPSPPAAARTSPAPASGPGRLRLLLLLLLLAVATLVSVTLLMLRRRG